MANKTDPTAGNVHGTDPQYLIEKILRTKIHEAPYWKEHCFGLTAESLVDKAVELQYVGGTFGGNRKPTPFMCLMLKMLQIQPEREIIIEFILNDDYKYVRILGAFYLRLIGRPMEVYQYLEPLLNDYRKIRYKEASGKVVLTNVDAIIDDLLTKEFFMDITLPRLARRQTLEETHKLPARESALDELNAKEDETDEPINSMPSHTSDTAATATASSSSNDTKLTADINEDDEDDGAVKESSSSSSTLAPSLSSTPSHPESSNGRSRSRSRSRDDHRSSRRRSRRNDSSRSRSRSPSRDRRSSRRRRRSRSRSRSRSRDRRSDRSSKRSRSRDRKRRSRSR